MFAVGIQKSKVATATTVKAILLLLLVDNINPQNPVESGIFFIKRLTEPLEENLAGFSHIAGVVRPF
jgi:hypothetical protein